MKQKQENDIFYNDDEINLIDLIKIIYKWRYYVLTVVLLFTLIGGYIGLRKIKEPDMYKATVIIQPAMFNNETVVNINDIVNSGSMAMKIFNNIDKSILKKEKIFKDVNNKPSIDVLLNQWQAICKHRIVVKDNKITFLMFTKQGLYKVSDIIMNYVLLKQKKLLDDKFNNYLNNTKKLFEQLSFATKRNISIQSLSIPIGISPKVIITAKENTVIEKKPSLIKYLVISFFIGIFVGLIFPFIMEFFSKLDLSQITRK